MRRHPSCALFAFIAVTTLTGCPNDASRGGLGSATETALITKIDDLKTEQDKLRAAIEQLQDSKAKSKEIDALKAKIERLDANLSHLNEAKLDELHAAVKLNDIPAIQKTLSQIGALGPSGRSAIPTLRKLVEHPNADVRHSAASTLQQVNTTIPNMVVTFVLALVVHLACITLIGMMAYLAVRLCWEDKDHHERGMRVVAAVVAILVFTVAKILGISVGAGVRTALAWMGQISADLTFAALGTAMGIAMARWCVKMMRREGDVARRITILCLLLAAAVSADAYSNFTGGLTWEDLGSGLPLICFASGFGAWMIFKYSRPRESVQSVTQRPAPRAPLARQ